MDSKVSISYYLDKRRAKKNGKFPLKLSVFLNYPRQRKMYDAGFEFEYDEDEDIDELSKVMDPSSRGKNKDTRNEINALILKAEQIAEKIIPFSFEIFEKKMYGKAGEDSLLHVAYSETINSFLKRKKIGTASTYELSEKSIIDFVAHTLNISDEKRKDKKEADKLDKKYKKLSFHNITPSWLIGYQDFMTERGRSTATISMYLRSLRALFNAAMIEGVEGIVYPFSRKKGDGKYKIPKADAGKRALSKEQLSILFHSEPLTPEQKKAKDFWFFSYACSGMNIKDVANLKHKDFDEDSFSFYRAKTRSTSANARKIQVYLNDYTRGIIEKYGSKTDNPNDFVFDIISKNDSAETQHSKISNFNCFISQNLKKLCKEIGLPKEISAGWARHSWATIAHNDNKPIKFIMESLGHQNIQTTQNYLNSFPDKDKREYTNNLMNF